MHGPLLRLFQQLHALLLPPSDPNPTTCMHAFCMMCIYPRTQPSVALLLLVKLATCTAQSYC
jgi:hypothetical protein